VITSCVLYLATIISNYDLLFHPEKRTTGRRIASAPRYPKKSAPDTAGTGFKRPASVRSDIVKVLAVLLTGSPNPIFQLWNYVTIAVNIFLTVFTLDLVFRGPLLYSADELRFSRVGYVDSTSAKLLFREPDTGELPVHVYYQVSSSDLWTTAHEIDTLGEETDYTYPVSFTGLLPETAYTYALSNNLTGTFTTSPTPGSTAGKSLAFLTSSCIKANFPYNLFNHALDIPGFEHLSRALSSIDSPIRFMLFLGDFIYVDVPLRLSSTTTHYRSEYRRVYASRSWSLPLLSGLPWLHTLDDHEIANDWSDGNSAPYPAANDPFRHYHVSINPPVPNESSKLASNTTYFYFSNGPASFFMLDTRAYRTPAMPTESSKANSTMLGADQLQSLLRYLRTPEPVYIHWKFVASSVPFTKNWRFGNADTWGGYLHERSKVLEAMHFAERELGVRVVVLSGDRHEFGAIRFPDRQHTATTATSTVQSHSGPHEFSVGPLSMFYLPIRTFWQVDDEDVMIEYVPTGNSKFGVVQIEGVEDDRVKSKLRYTLWVDGKVRWEYVLTSPTEEPMERSRIADNSED
jgi:alkaline phosphatase D